jgi:hypothetical protein
VRQPAFAGVVHCGAQIRSSWRSKSFLLRRTRSARDWNGSAAFHAVRAGIAADLGVSRRDVGATVMGEHGRAIIPLWRSVELLSGCRAPRQVKTMSNSVKPFEASARIGLIPPPMR